MSFPNQLVAFLTLGIYTPMSIKATCSLPGAVEQARVPLQPRPEPAARDSVEMELSPDEVQRREDARRRGRIACTPSDVQMGVCSRADTVYQRPGLGTLEATSAPSRRDGFWIGFGLGYGLVNESFDFDAWDGAGAGYFRLGGTLNETTLIGFESTSWVEIEDGDVLAVSHGGVSVFSYPAGGNFFMRVGVGVATIGLYTDSFTDTQTGFSVLGGVGVDLPIGARSSITPGVNYYRGWYDGGALNVFQVVLGLSFH